MALGAGAERWLVEAAATGAQRVRTKMAEALEVAALVGTDAVDRALGLAAMAGRFGDGDLVSILERLRVEDAALEVFAAAVADEAHSAQPGTNVWEGFGR